MLRPSALKSLLGQANSGGVSSTLLLNREGSLVAYAGVVDTEARVNGAIAASIWASYEKSAKAAFAPSQTGLHGKGNNLSNSNSLKFVILDCDEGLAALASLPESDFVVCALADKTCEFGMIKKKILALAEALQEPLAQS